jgi:hypothetical protein
MSETCERGSCEREFHGDRDEPEGTDKEIADRDGPSGYEPL